MFTRGITSFVMSFCALAFSGCGGQLYNVTPLPSTAPDNIGATDNKGMNDADGINVHAAALDGDQSLERFDANLPLAGVAAVEVDLANRSAVAINPRSLKFQLRDSTGRSFPVLTPKNALKRVMKFYGDAFYRMDARQRTIEAYDATALSLGSVIAPQEMRRGILFFEVQRNTTKLDGLTLSAAGITPPINVKIN